MGNATGTPTGASPVHATALRDWLRDIGVAYGSEFLADDRRWPEHRLANAAEDVGQQFAMLPRVFACCGCGVHVESMRLDWPDQPPLPTAFARAVADVAARGDLQRCVDRCRHPRCVVPLAWWWNRWQFPDQCQSEHLTLLVLDRDERVQWFFDPGNAERYGIPMTAWMAGVALLPGYRPRTVRFARHDGLGLLGLLAPLPGDDTVRLGGSCTAVCLLLVAALWRFGLPEPPALLAALAGWLEELAADPRHHRAVRRRLFRWQHAVTAADDRRRLFELFGLSDPVGDVAARPCAVFTGPAAVCEASGTTLDSGDDSDPVRCTLCYRHAAELLVAEVLAPTVAAGVPQRSHGTEWW